MQAIGSPLEINVTDSEVRDLRRGEDLVAIVDERRAD